MPSTVGSAPNPETPLLPHAVVNSGAHAAVVIPVVAEDLYDDASWQQLLKELMIQSWPLMLRGAVTSARYFGCAVFLSKVDENLLAANTLINAMESIYIIFGGRSLAIVSSEVGRLMGVIQKTQKEKAALPEADEAGRKTLEDQILETQKQIGIVVRHGAVLAGVMGLPMAGLYYFANHHILKLLGQHHFAVDKAKDYFQGAALGFIALNFLTAQQRLLQGMKETVPVLLSNTVHCSLCIAFSYLFLFGKLGFPQLEMLGVGYAFTIAGAITILSNTLYLWRKKTVQPYHVFTLEGGFQWALFKMLAKKGLQTGLQNTTENVANMINSLFLGLHNLTALAADQMAMNVALFISITSGGLAQAISVCVGNALGASKYRTLKRHGNIGILVGMSFPVIACLVLLAARRAFISLFVNIDNPDNAELVRLASEFLLMECLRQLMTGLQLTTATGGLLGLKATEFPMYTSIGCSLIVNAMVVSLMHFALHMNSLALFASKAIGMGLTALLNLSYWIMKSHEQSPEEKEAIKDKALSYRVGRAARLFVCDDRARPAHNSEEAVAAVIVQ